MNKFVIPAAPNEWNKWTISLLIHEQKCSINTPNRVSRRSFGTSISFLSLYPVSVIWLENNCNFKMFSLLIEKKYEKNTFVLRGRLKNGCIFIAVIIEVIFVVCLLKDEIFYLFFGVPNFWRWLPLPLSSFYYTRLIWNRDSRRALGIEKRPKSFRLLKMILKIYNCGPYWNLSTFESW